MKKKKKGLTRRDFLKGAAGVGVVGASSMTLFCEKKDQQAKATVEEKAAPVKKALATKKAKVVLIRDEAVLDQGRKVNPQVISKMFDDGVMALLDAKSPEEAWAKLIKSSDTVGIKSNVWRFLPTPPALEEAIHQRIMGAGVPAERIAIGDRDVLDDPVFKKSTALINVRPLRTHHWSGVGSCIKNHIMFSPMPFAWHGDSCAKLAGIWELPIIKGKTRLNILVMLTPLFHGKGPHHFQANYTWEYKGLIIGTDPVAVDATGLRILQAKRREFFGKNEPFAASPKHIEVAEVQYGLGVADPERIEIKKLGWMEGVLI
jgi:hypothetical protein